MKQLTIDIKGKTTGDLIIALLEVSRLVDDGFLSGQNSNEFGRYQFNCKDVPKLRSKQIKRKIP